MNRRDRWFGLFAIRLGTGGFGVTETVPEIEGWYKTIGKPTWNPGDSVIGSVWTTLVVLMSIAAWLVWKPVGFKAATKPLVLFGLQLVVNVEWSWPFFGQHQPVWVFAEIVVLGATTILFFHYSKIAGWLRVPYLA